MYNLRIFNMMALAVCAAPVWAQGGASNLLSERQGIEHRLVKLAVAGEEITLPPRPIITLTFLEGNRVAGRGPVNRFFGGYHLADDGTLHWAGSGTVSGPAFGSTMMAGPPDLMNLEQTFFQALGAVNRLEARGSALVIENEDKSTSMVFEANSVERVANALMGTRLMLTRLIAEGREIPIPVGTAVVLTVDRSGHAAGYTGVNRYRGTVQFPAAGQIEFPSAFATTRMSGPEELMTLERSYLNALSTVKRWRPSLNGAVMESANGSTVLEFTTLR
jgi:heat shock protein HslJ